MTEQRWERGALKCKKTAYFYQMTMTLDNALYIGGARPKVTVQDEKGNLGIA